MLFHILIGASVFTKCFGEIASDQAVSSQSYKRGDVPLSYKYNFLHVYTTTKPHEHWKRHKDNYSQDNSRMQNHYKNIQYAPLPIKNQEDSSIGTLHTGASTFGYDGINVKENDNDYLHQTNAKKAHLEPQLVPTKSNHVRPHFVPSVAGHNMHIQAVNNSPEINGLLPNSEHGGSEEHPKVNLFHRQLAYHIPGVLRSIDVSDIPEYAKPNHAFPILAHQYEQDDKIYDIKIVPDKEKAELQSMVYVKAPKIQLNVARAYSIARAPYKASVNVNSAYRKLHSLPQNTQSQYQIAQSVNTQLHPVQHRNLYLFHRPT